ncbi:MAG: NHL repeat-containing protein [Gammaproteobacteria bacterium]
MSVVAAATVLLASCAWFPAAKEPPYRRVASWGEQGDGPGQFNEPTGIAVSTDEVFVADARNRRIQVFDFQGRFKRQFGEPGEGPGQLGRPMNLTLSAGELYVADYWNDRIQVYSLDGTYRRSIGESGSGPGQFNAPGGVAVAANGDIFVADFYNQRIQRLHADGQFVRQWGVPGEIGIRAGYFNYPTDVALSADDTLYVADGYNDRVQVFARDGSFLRKWGGPFAMNIFGPFNGWFATVTSIAIGPQGNVFVADFYNDRVQKFTPQGEFLTAFGSMPLGPVHTAMAVTVAMDGKAFVANLDRQRIEIWVQNN